MCKIFFLIVLGFSFVSYSQTRIAPQYYPSRLDTVRIQGYILTIGAQKYIRSWDTNGSISSIDSGYYGRQYFVPCDKEANIIGKFLDQYSPPDVMEMIMSKDSSKFKSSEIFILCPKGQDCNYFTNRQLNEFNKNFKRVLPDLVTNNLYVRKEDSLEVRIFFIDAMWLKFSLPAIFGFDNAPFSWPIISDMSKKECLYYYLLDYYSLSLNVEIKDELLDKLYNRISR